MNSVFGCLVFGWLLKSVFYPFPGSLRLGSQMNRLIQVTGQILIFLITLSLGITFFYNLKPNSQGATSFWVPTSVWESLLNAGENHRPEALGVKDRNLPYPHTNREQKLYLTEL